jgi:hypothetical protein
MPLGVLIAGYLLEQIGVRCTLLAVGSCYLLATSSLLFNTVLREMDQEQAVQHSTLDAL